MEWLDVAGRRLGITAYASRRMAQRGISKAEVQAVLADPTSVAPSRDSSFRFIYRRSVRGRRLIVVIEGLPGESWWVIVTTWGEGQTG